MLRAFAAYLRQLGSPFGLRYLAETLHAPCRAGARSDRAVPSALRSASRPHRRRSGRRQKQPIRRRIEGALAAVPSLDEDRILRQFHNLVDATVRTNFYQSDADGRRSATLAFKLDSKAVEAAPQPQPFREIWVYSPRVEAIHLRFAPIARGGIRWSDRAQDFRTEVLGLVRAQLVKNAVIVPSGAKGGFLPKLLPRAGGREEIQKEGVAAYRIFISALLDITDNIKDGKIVPPRHVVRHDGDDPYLVVAADKGTATFSDIANDISAAHDFWLGDAFASGGSAGYDHKGMAITARGAWECVKRHFREMDIDIQHAAVPRGGRRRHVGRRVRQRHAALRAHRAGGGLRSPRHLHRPQPRRQRPSPSASACSTLPRSSWQDYDKAKISKGGGVFSRTAKSIPLSEEMRRLLEVDAASLTPTELMRAILKCKTDLLWFGGIGTYVRASDRERRRGRRSRQRSRCASPPPRCVRKVIGEGANLGVTQRARIEFAGRGGRINTDFIDNSAGVNTSDQEVNIKIALAPAVRAGQLAPVARNTLLAQMTEDVAAASLRNNYQQSLALSLAERRSAREQADYLLLMRTLGDARAARPPARGAAVGHGAAGARARRPRPDAAGARCAAELCQDRAAARPARKRAFPTRPALESWLTAYFPTALRERYAGDIEKHSLRREIIALGLTNAIVNRGGPAMAVRLAEETQRTTADVAYAFLADARGVRAAGPVAAHRRARRQGQGRRPARALRGDAGPRERADALVPAQRRGDVRSRRHHRPPSRRRRRPEVGARCRAARAPAGAAGRGIAAARRSGRTGRPGRRRRSLDMLGLAPPITEIAEETKTAVADAARVYLAIGEQLRMSDLVTKAGAIATPDYYDRVAVAQALNQLASAQAAFTRDAIRSGDADAAQAWRGAAGRPGSAASRPCWRRLRAMATLTVSRLLVAAGQLGDLGLDERGRSFSISQAGPSSRSSQIRRQRKPAPS